MATMEELDSVYMQTAILHSNLSKANRLKVGACLVLDSGVMIGGTNGLPKLLGNSLEYFDDESKEFITKKEVIHAEQSCLNKACVEGLSTKGARMYINYSCCAHCASNMIACGIVEVIYLNDYRDYHGIDLLMRSNIAVRKIERELW